MKRIHSQKLAGLLPVLLVRTCLALGMLPVSLFAQGFHTPAEFFQIIQSSSLQYEISEVDTFVARPFQMPVNDSYTYQVKDESGIRIARFAPEPIVADLLTKGETEFKNRNFDEAVVFFQQVVNREPAFSVPHVYLALCALNSGKVEAAAKHIGNALTRNYWDHLAHLTQARVHQRKGELDQAMHEAAIAFVLNPNDELVNQETKRIFEDCGMEFMEFLFQPNYAMGHHAGKVEIKMSMPWMMYAICKAVWQFEPDYRQSRPYGGSHEFNLLEEKECLLNLAASLKEMKRKDTKQPAIAALTQALEARMLEQFIFVEIWLRREPLIIYTQPKHKIPELARYVMAVRGGKKK